MPAPACSIRAGPHGSRTRLRQSGAATGNAVEDARGAFAGTSARRQCRDSRLARGGPSRRSFDADGIIARIAARGIRGNGARARIGQEQPVAHQGQWVRVRVRGGRWGYGKRSGPLRAPRSSAWAAVGQRRWFRAGRLSMFRRCGRGRCCMLVRMPNDHVITAAGASRRRGREGAGHQGQDHPREPNLPACQGLRRHWDTHVATGNTQCLYPYTMPGEDPRKNRLAHVGGLRP